LPGAQHARRSTNRTTSHGTNLPKIDPAWKISITLHLRSDISGMEPCMNTLATASAPQTANRKPQTANRKPHYYIITIKWLQALLVVLGGVPLAAAAALSNCSVTFTHASWATTGHDVFIASEEFNALSNGDRVSLNRWFGVQFKCSITNTTPQYGIGMAMVPGAINVTGMDNTFTTPQLQALGGTGLSGQMVYLHQREHHSKPAHNTDTCADERHPDHAAD